MIENDEPDRFGSVDRTRRQTPPEASNSANVSDRSGLGNEFVDEHRQPSSRSPEDAGETIASPSHSKPNPELNRNCVSSDDMLALLVCPICPTGALLQRPTTLRCGHSICQSHILGSDDSPVSRPLATDSTPSSLSQRRARPSVPLTVATSSSSASATPTSRTRPSPSPVSPVSRVQAFHCPVGSCNDPLSSNRMLHPTVELIISPAAQNSNATNTNASHRNRNNAGGGSISPNSAAGTSERRQSTPIDVRLSQILSLAREFSLRSNKSSPLQAQRNAPHARDASATSRPTRLQAFSSSSQPSSLTPPHSSSDGREVRVTRAGTPSKRPNHQDHREEDCTFTDRLLELLNCEVCLNPLKDPITTPCQHVSTSPSFYPSIDTLPYLLTHQTAWAYFIVHSSLRMIYHPRTLAYWAGLAREDILLTMFTTNSGP